MSETANLDLELAPRTVACRLNITRVCLTKQMFRDQICRRCGKSLTPFGLFCSSFLVLLCLGRQKSSLFVDLPVADTCPNKQVN